MNYVKVAADLCKGCRVCVNTCPNHCLMIGSKFNKMGYQNVQFSGENCCTACGLCFYVCPEPGALTVLKDEPAGNGSKEAAGDCREAVV